MDNAFLLNGTVIRVKGSTWFENIPYSEDDGLFIQGIEIVRPMLLCAGKQGTVLDRDENSGGYYLTVDNSNFLWPRDALERVPAVRYMYQFDNDPPFFLEWNTGDLTLSVLRNGPGGLLFQANGKTFRIFKEEVNAESNS